MAKPPKPPRPAPDWTSLPVSGGSLDPLNSIQGVTRIRPVTHLRTASVSERPAKPSGSPRALADDATHLNHVAQVLELAQEKLGTEAAALTWLKAPHPALGGLAPQHVMVLEPGLMQVFSLLDKMDKPA